MNHAFILLAEVGEDPQIERAAEYWYWCPMCGTLSLNEAEFWVAPVVIESEGVLPLGLQSPPPCKEG
jgi:hypothetical protein